VVINVETGEFDGSGLDVSASWRAKGGFATLVLVDSGGNVVVESETFTQVEVPEQAQNAGPSDGACDGKGIDSVGACAGF
jgi:hypothetical protein